MANERTFWHGDAAIYTGETDVIAGGRFYALRLVEGHRQGQVVWTALPPSTVAREAVDREAVRAATLRGGR